MRSFLSIAALATSAMAFPSQMFNADSAIVRAANSGVLKRQISGAVPPQGQGALPLTPPPFDAASQYVSNKGQYAFVAPGPGDARGMCPGLNAAANHGYLVRS